MSIQDFDLLNKLGDGAFSSVYKVGRKSDGQIYALKKVKMGVLKQKEKENALNEVRIMASYHHPNIIAFKEAFLDEASNSLCIVMELAEGGDLLKKIETHKLNRTRFPESEIWEALIQITRGLKALHERNILHRDLKCANVFIGSDGVFKLGDLNVSKVNKRGMAVTQTGTPYYASPEVWKDMPYNSSSDIWSLGCVIYEMAALNPPFTGVDMQSLYSKIIKGTYPNIPGIYSQELSSVIRSMLQVNPNARPTCQKILELPSVQRYSAKLGNGGEEINSNLLGTIKFEGFHALKNKLPESNYGGSERVASARTAKREELDIVKERAILTAKGGRPPVTQMKPMINDIKAPIPIIEEYIPKSTPARHESSRVRPLIDQAKVGNNISKAAVKPNGEGGNLIRQKKPETNQVSEIQKLQDMLNNPQKYEINNLYSDRAPNSNRVPLKAQAKDLISPKASSRPLSRENSNKLDYKSPLQNDLYKAPIKEEKKIVNDPVQQYKALIKEERRIIDSAKQHLAPVREDKKVSDLYKPSPREDKKDLLQQYRPNSREKIPSAQQIGEDKKINDLYKPSPRVEEKKDLYQQYRPSSKEKVQGTESYQQYRPSSKEKVQGTESYQYRPSSKEKLPNVDSYQQYRPSSREKIPTTDAYQQYRPNSREKPSGVDSYQQYRPNSREQQSGIDSYQQYRPNSREKIGADAYQQYKAKENGSINIGSQYQIPQANLNSYDQYKPQPQKEYRPELYQKYISPTQEKRVLDQNISKLQSKEEKKAIDNFQQQYKSPYSQDRKNPNEIKRDSINYYEKKSDSQPYKSPIIDNNQYRPSSREDKKVILDRYSNYESHQNIDSYQNYRVPSREAKDPRSLIKDDKIPITEMYPSSRGESRDDPRVNPLLRKPSYQSNNPVVPQVASREASARKVGLMIASPRVKPDPLPSYNSNNNQLKAQYDRLQNGLAQQRNVGSQKRIEPKPIWWS